jgi:hypothetical protein
VGTSSVAADALLMNKAFDKGADLLDNRNIYQRVDKAGVGWKFGGRNWERQETMTARPRAWTIPLEMLWGQLREGPRTGRQCQPCGR